MRFVYAIINLLILAGLIYLFGRKTIGKIFRSRRERIARELDEAEAPFIPEPLPEIAAPDDTALQSELAAAEDAEKAALAEIEAQYEADAADQRREMLFTTRARIIEQVLSLAEQYMRSEEYQASKRARQYEAVEQILAQIHLTPGDVSYLSRKGVLYVTLTSSAALSDDLVEKVRARSEALVAAVGGKISLWVRQNEELIGGLQLRIGDTIYDYTISNKLYRLGKALNDRPLTETDAESIRAGMLDAVRHMKLGIDVFQVGRVLSVSDGRNVADLFEAKNVRAILHAVSSMDEETKNAIADAFRRLGSSLRETLPEWVESTAGQIRTMIAQRSEKESE